MDYFSKDAITIILFLAPGFLVSAILEFFVERREKSDLSKVIEAVLYTVLISAIYSLLYKGSPVLVEHVTESNTRISFDGIALLLLIGLSIIVGLISSIILNKDLIFRLSSKMRFRIKTSRPSTWLDVFYTKGGFIIIHFEDGRRLSGWVEYFSHDQSEPYLYLINAAWINNEDEYKDIESEGILVTPNQKISFIYFDKRGTIYPIKEA
jgi:hypothetical protein